MSRGSFMLRNALPAYVTGTVIAMTIAMAIADSARIRFRDIDYA
jgi:hypothetical protein